MSIELYLLPILFQFSQIKLCKFYTLSISLNTKYIINYNQYYNITVLCNNYIRCQIILWQKVAMSLNFTLKHEVSFKIILIFII